jgi:hypothetical protein
MVLTELKMLLKEAWEDKGVRFATYGMGLVLCLWALQEMVS